MEAAASADDLARMDDALREAERALAEGEVPVGCVVADARGAVVARGRNATHRSGDATAHAEVVALRALRGGGGGGGGLTLFVTCEPCVMCAGALLASRLFARVVFGCANARFGGCGSVRALDVHAPPRPAVVRGVRAPQALALLVAFYARANPYAPTPKPRRKRLRDACADDALALAGARADGARNP